MNGAPRFSSRTAWDLSETKLTAAINARRAGALPLIDLTASNPTRCGFEYDEAAILPPLATSRSLDYDPDPRGMLSAREAVCRYYAERGADLPLENILLTTSTSEAYSYLFRLLCDPGDEVLIAQPSYPLFDFLAQIEDVRLEPYPLFYDHGWHLDADGLRRRITSRTRAIALVHPNNPTGHFTRTEERRELEAICAEHGLALIVDEVFLDYGLEGQTQPSFATGEHPILTFVLSGLSKVAALPQMKAAWIAFFGPPAILKTALERLHVIADTFLSMNAPVQCALPDWLTGGAKIRRQIDARLRANLAALDRELVGTPISRLAVKAGWYAVLRVPAIEPDEELAVRLISEAGVVVHPGHFFGFPASGWLVVSQLVEPSELTAGIRFISSVFR
ncbi:MAG TPA: pyridoxal phosphate-dependent aminotransferase [Silvibacterium sp.]|nr:pyridoxal phosphate-dependent aminotransferase [Silvibacterium sp.]